MPMEVQVGSTIKVELRLLKTLTASWSLVSNDYAWNILEKTISKKRKEYRDSNTKENIEKLKEELMDIKNIMHENFEMVLNRDKNLGKITQMSSDLKDNSKKVSRNQKKSITFNHDKLKNLIAKKRCKENET